MAAAEGAPPLLGRPEYASEQPSGGVVARACAPISVGTRCHYRTQSGERLLVTVLKVHFDDPTAEYYTIDVEGSERSTTRERLEPVAEMPGPVAAAPPLTSFRAPAEAGDIDKAPFWYYQDTSCQEQGPFASETMRSWQVAGYFLPTLCVAPSYYGEVPSTYWPLDALWEVPRKQAFGAAVWEPPEEPAAAATKDDVTVAAESTTSTADADAGQSEDAGVAAGPLDPITGAVAANAWHPEYSAATKARDLEGGAERQHKFLRLLGANKQQRSLWREDVLSHFREESTEPPPVRGHDYTRGNDGGFQVDEAKVDELLSARLRARLSRDFATADAMRDRLRAELGVEVYDNDREWK